MIIITFAHLFRTSVGSFVVVYVYIYIYKYIYKLLSYQVALIVVILDPAILFVNLFAMPVMIPCLQTKKFEEAYLSLQTLKKARSLTTPIITIIAEFNALSEDDFRWLSPDGRDMTYWAETSDIGGFSGNDWTIQGGSVLDASSWGTLLDEFHFLK
jgi:hypothetical protein